MSNMRGQERIRVISEEAAEWFIRCCDEPMMMLADRRELVAWMRRSPENIAELLRIARLDGKIGQQKLILRAAGLDESNVIELGLVAGGGSQYDLQHQSDESADVATDQGHHEQMNKRMSSPWKIAATVAALTVAFLFGFIQKNQWLDDTVTTQASQWQHMTLEDGSVVHVGARTKLRVDFSDERRIVHLYRGEAVFEVAKDSARPFTVSTHLIDATAVGTRFGVAIDSGVTTTVSEGVVRVTARGKSDGHHVLLEAGQELQVSDSGLHAPNLAKVNAERKLEWANGWLVFEGETIEEAVNEFNRRNAVQIEIDQPAIAARRLGYYRLRVDSPEAFVKLIAKETGMKMTGDRSSNVLRLQRE